MARNVSNTLRQKLETADNANHSATLRLRDACQGALESAADIDTRPAEDHLRTLLDQVHLVRPRLAEDLRTTIDVLNRIAAHNARAGREG